MLDQLKNDRTAQLLLGLVVLAIVVICCGFGFGLFALLNRDSGLAFLNGSTPTPTPIPTTANLLDSLRAAGLEVSDVAPMEELPPGTVDALKFYTPSLCDGCSSMVFVFDNEAHAIEAVGRFDMAAQVSEAFQFHVYQHGRVVLRMGGLIDEARAYDYAKTLNLVD